MADAVVIALVLVLVVILARTRGRVPPARQPGTGERPSYRWLWARRLATLGLAARIGLVVFALVLIAALAHRLSS